jgi:small subunit ribosomal protein S6
MTEQSTANHLREYETIFLVKPDLTDEGVDRVKDRVRGIVNREGGKLIRFTVWGKKKTMFPVSKQPRAIYVHASYLGGHSLVAEVERNLRNLDEVTRWLSVKVADDVDPESRPVQEDVKLAGDVDEARGPAPERAGPARDGIDPEGLDEEVPEEA